MVFYWFENVFNCAQLNEDPASKILKDQNSTDPNASKSEPEESSPKSNPNNPQLISAHNEECKKSTLLSGL